MTDAVPYDLVLTRIDGTTVPLDAWRGQVLLVVNVASQCGFTPQYAGLEALYRRYHERGLVVLGFPCDQFGLQEPGTNAEIDAFCTGTYGVTFPMFGKTLVNGPKAHPLFAFLTSQKRGWLGSARIKWNFTKFLVSRRGRVLKRVSPARAPASLEHAILKALAEQV